MAKQSLIALLVEDLEAAHELFHDLSVSDEQDDNVRIEDAVAAYKTADGRIKLEQSADATTGDGLFGGGAVGVVVGLVAGGPIGAAVGAVAGSVIGGLYASVRDSGINNRMVKDLAAKLEPGKAALVLLFSGELNPDMIAMLGSRGQEILVDTLPEGASAAIQNAIAAAGVSAPAIVAAMEITPQADSDFSEVH